jgi:CIC family chloride channel protein
MTGRCFYSSSTLTLANPQAFLNLSGQRAMLRAQFGDGVWECPQILDALDSTNELYFDRVSQIRMPRWSQGRIALVGDAAYCVSLMAGQGSALAMTGAYVLAGELAKSSGDPRQGFANYEKVLRSFIETKQRGAEHFAGAPMAPWQRITLVAAGPGAGIAATFNTPIGGVMFAIELMMPELSARTFLPVALATGTATFIGRIFFGIHPAFNIPSDLLTSQHPATLAALLLFALLGTLIGLAATGFIRGLSFAEDLFERIENPYLRHITGMFGLGVLIYVLFRTAGHYYVEGVGYSTIQAILTGGLGFPALLFILFIAKLCATSTSLGSGSSGGIFSPSLFMGATIGGAFGAAITAIQPVEGVSVITCAIIGMAAMVGGGTGAAMTAVTMIFEMTRDYDLVMPSILAVALAIGIRRLLSVENIYTIKLVGRGHAVPKAMHANMFLVRRAGEVMEPNVTIVPAEADFDAFLRDHAEDRALRHVVVTRGNHIAGVVRVNTGLRRGVEAAYSGVHFGDIAQRNFTLARETDVMFDVVHRMARRHATMAVVTTAKGRWRPVEIVGIISKEHVADSVAESIKPFG